MKSTLSWEDSKCKGPGAGVMIDGERGDSPECQAERSAEEVCRSRLEESIRPLGEEFMISF